MLMYLILRLAVFLARRLPERWGLAVARWLGNVIYRISPLAEAGRDNARHILGPDADPNSVSQLARQAFQSRLLNYYDLVRLSGMPLDQFKRQLVLEGVEHLDQLVAEGRGGVVLSGHLGPTEFMIQAVSSLGYPLLAVVEQLEPERLHQYITSLRSAHGLRLVLAQGLLLDVYRWLKRGGGMLVSAIDRDTTDTGVVVDFFGAPAWMPDGYARIAVRADMPVIFGFCRRTPGGVLVKVLPLIYPDQSLAKEEAVLDLIQRALQLFEGVIREYPGEWHLSTPIWQLAQERLAREAAG